MRYIDDDSVDAVIADLPYSFTANNWDKPLPLDLLWKEYWRVCKKNAPMVFTASQPFTSVLGASNIGQLKYAWVWKKSSVTGHLNAHRMPLKTHEDILVFCRDRARYNPQGLLPYQKIKRRGNNGKNYGVSGTENYQEWTNYPRSIIEFNNDSSKLHPTQKPLALIEYLVLTYTDEGDTVLDNTAGSFTLAVACDNLKRNWICIEQQQEYCEIGARRIEENRKRLIGNG